MKVLQQITDFKMESPDTEPGEIQTIYRTNWLGMKAVDGMKRTENHNPRNILTLSPKGWGRKNSLTWTFSRSQWLELCKKAETRAVCFGQYKRPETGVEYYFYAYNDTYYVSQIKLDEEDATTIIEQDRKKTEDALWREVERVKARAEAEGAIRQPIPEAIQVLVWNRDQGKCVKCGSKENLEFDHIIPLSKGGSNTARNIQLLCEKCNRSKGSTIGG
jgi:hypothetical protein